MLAQTLQLQPTVALGMIMLGVGERGDLRAESASVSTSRFGWVHPIEGSQDLLMLPTRGTSSTRTLYVGSTSTASSGFDLEPIFDGVEAFYRVWARGGAVHAIEADLSTDLANRYGTSTVWLARVGDGSTEVFRRSSASYFLGEFEQTWFEGRYVPCDDQRCLAIEPVLPVRD